MFKLDLSREARRFYEQCDKVAAKKLARCFESLEQNPRSGNNVEPLKGPLVGSYRYRVGDLRVIYMIDDWVVTVFVIAIARRGDVYK